MGVLEVPPLYFKDFLRGVIDGDGNVRRWIHPTNLHEQWEVRICSASHKFVDWLQEQIQDLFQVTGILIINNPPNRNPMYVLKFGKMAARQLLSKIYYENALALPRKQVLAKACINSYVGWKQSVTVTK